jgi:dihydroxyacid dehydratase/phosphogluconate dehydratase
MTSIADAIGFTLPGASSIPAADAAHPRMASQCGETIVDLVWRDRRPSTWLTPAHFANGVAVYMAMGGSTNAAIHLIAVARRAGIDLTLDQLAETAAKIPVLLNLFPSGNALMEDYHFAGGLRALMREITPFLNLECAGATGQTWDTLLADAKCYDSDIIRGLDNPVVGLDQGSTLALLRGNLCPDGAVMKSSAANPSLRKHSGPALVFDDHETLSRMIDDPALDITADTVLILRNAGPVGAPGMPEWGNLPIPKKLLEAGVRDMLRISDSRMSGTHYGSCVLHVAPEAAVGGPLCLVRTGDIIDLDIAAGTLNMRVSDEELASRRAAHVPVHRQYGRSFAALYQQHVTQANDGCDFDFLQAGEAVPEPPIH